MLVGFGTIGCTTYHLKTSFWLSAAISNILAIISNSCMTYFDILTFLSLNSLYLDCKSVGTCAKLDDEGFDDAIWITVDYVKSRVG